MIKKKISSLITNKFILNKDIGDLDKILIIEQSKLDIKLKEEIDKLDNIFKEDIN